MSSQREFDLSEFLGESLSHQNNIAAPTRVIKSPKPDDYYEKFVLRDPYEILGEKNFKRRQDVPETEIGTPIQEFFRGANVFITGATGFVGMVLTEKLIRSIPHIGQIYLLIRPKRGLILRERFDKLLEDKLFNRVKAEVPDFATRLTPVEGDLATPGLGLSPADRHTLIDRVNVVFHSAADVRFTETLRVAVCSNVYGSRRVLQLAREMKNLWAYVHVSTAYSQCVRRVIDENIPKLNFNYQELLEYIESKTDDELLEETPRLLHEWPNTYVFSKAICEEMLKEEAKDLPLSIFRPSIVMGTYKEPVRGWTNSLSGPIGLFVGAGHGVLHCFRMVGELSTDIVPVDMVVNCLITVAWKTTEHRVPRTPEDSLAVYNFCSSALTPGQTWKSTVGFLLESKDHFPFPRAVWYTSFFYVENHYVYQIFWYLLHRLPGAVIDKMAELTGGKPFLTPIYKRLESVKTQIEYFCTHAWIFNSDNVINLWRSLAEDDQKIFPFDLREVDPNENLLIFKLGVEYYYLNEDLESIPAVLRKNTMLYWLHQSLKCMCCVLVLKLFVMLSHVLPF